MNICSFLDDTNRFKVRHYEANIVNPLGKYLHSTFYLRPFSTAANNVIENNQLNNYNNNIVKIKNPQSTNKQSSETQNM